MQNAKKRQNPVGGASQTVMFPGTFAVTTSGTASVTPRRERIVIERPQLVAVRRTCAWCGALYDDHTGHETVYCRDSCKVRMYERKRDSAAAALAAAWGLSVDEVWLELDPKRGGLKHVEKLLNSLGYSWERDQKGWIK